VVSVRAAIVPMTAQPFPPMVVLFLFPVGVYRRCDNGKAEVWIRACRVGS